MSGDREDRPTVMTRIPSREPEPARGGGRRDDKTRLRMPSVDGGAPQGRSGGSDATRMVQREGTARAQERPGGGHTVRMQAIPRRFGWLIVKSGTRVGQVHALGEVTDLGRGPQCHIQVDDEKASEQHARMRLNEEGQFVLWDLASTNGTFVNGEQIMAATPMVENDELRIGQTVLVLKTLDLKE